MKKVLTITVLVLSLLVALAAPVLAAESDAAEVPEEDTAGAAYRLISAVKYTDGEQTSAYELIYDGASVNLPSTVRYTSPSWSYESTYTYREDGRVLTYHQECISIEQRTTDVFNYDDEGKLVQKVETIESESYDSNGNSLGMMPLTEYYNYSYNDAGELANCIITDEYSMDQDRYEYTYTDGQMTSEKHFWYSYSPDMTKTERVTEYIYTYDDKGREATSERYDDGELVSASEQSYNGILYIVKANSGYVSANLLNESDFQIMSIGMSVDEGEPELIYDDAGRLVRIETSNEGTYIELTYESGSDASADTSISAPEVLSNVVMMDNEYCTLTLDNYVAPNMYLSFTNKSSDSVNYLSSSSIVCNGLSIPTRIRTDETAPGETTRCVITLEPDTLERFGINYIENITIHATLGQTENNTYWTAAEDLSASVDFPVPADAEGPSMSDPIFSIEPIELISTDDFKVSIVDAVAGDELDLVVYFENYTGKMTSVSVKEFSVNGTPAPMNPYYGSYLSGDSYAEKGYMEGHVSYQSGNAYSSDISALLGDSGPLQTVELTMAVFQKTDDGSDGTHLCPPVTIQF